MSISGPGPAPKPATEGMLYRHKARIRALLGVEEPGREVTVTAANWLTLVRLAIVPFFWYAFFSDDWRFRLGALFLFALGAVTDIFDGKIARARGQITPFGDFMDPLADKLLVLSGFWGIWMRMELGALSPVVMGLAMAISLRELMLTVMRMSALGGGVTVVTSYWGKLKTGVQLVTLLSILTILSLRDIFTRFEINAGWFEGGWLVWFITGTFLLSAISSWVSGWLYLKGALKSRAATE